MKLDTKPTYAYSRHNCLTAEMDTYETTVREVLSRVMTQNQSLKIQD